MRHACGFSPVKMPTWIYLMCVNRWLTWDGTLLHLGGVGEEEVPAVKFWLSRAVVQHRTDLTLKGSKDFVSVFLPFHKTIKGYCCIPQETDQWPYQIKHYFPFSDARGDHCWFSRILQILQDASDHHTPLRSVMIAGPHFCSTTWSPLHVS